MSRALSTHPSCGGLVLPLATVLPATNILVGMFLLASTFAPSATNTVPGVVDAQVMLQTGKSHSTVVVPATDVVPFEGNKIQLDTLTVPSLTCTSNCFGGIALDGDYYWLVPYHYPNNNAVVRYHRHTGAATHYSGWPGGVTRGTYSVHTSAFDRTRNVLWLIPYEQSHLVYVDTTTGNMNYCATWPGGGFSTGGRKFIGGVLEGANLWLSPYQASSVVKVVVTTCAMTAYTPAGVSFVGSYHWVGAIFDGDHYMWSVPRMASHFLKTNLWTGVISIYGSWPSGYISLAGGGSVPLTGICAFDGQSVWVPPYSANMVLKVDKDTGGMVGFGAAAMPANYGTLHFGGAMYDGKYVWMQPGGASLFLRIDVSTDAITGLAPPWNWPGGSSSTTIDFTTQSMIFAYHNGLLLRARLITPTVVEGQLIMQDGHSFSTNYVQANEVIPFEGESLKLDILTVASLGCTANCFGGITLDGDYLWLIPYEQTNNAVVRFHKVTGAVTRYTGWPAGVTRNQWTITTTVLDHTRNVLWLIPYDMSHLVYVDTTTGNMNYCATWPTLDFAGGAFSTGSWKFQGAVLEGVHLWMNPYQATSVVRVEVTTCAMTAYTPTGVTFTGSYHWLGAVFDGDHYMWSIPRLASHFLKTNLWTGVISIFNSWPSGYISLAGGGSVPLQGHVAFDGQSVWVPPYSANMILKVDKDTGGMVGFGAAALPANYGTLHFGRAIYDGKYVWITPGASNIFLRIEASTDTITGISPPLNWPVGSPWGNPVTVTIDFSTQSFFWVYNEGVVLKVRVHTPTPTLSRTIESTQTDGLIQQDGSSYSSLYVPAKNVVPLEGTEIHYESYPISASWGCTTTCTTGIVDTGDDYIWLVPYMATMVVRFHKVTHASNGYSGWPGGSLTLGTYKFSGAAFDHTRNILWMAAYEASYPAYVDTTTGTINYCGTWPGGGFSAGTRKFRGAVVDRDYVWLGMYEANQMIRIDVTDCSMVGFAPPATGITYLGQYRWYGLVFDGDRTMWSVRRQTTHLLKIDSITGVMTAFDGYPAAWVEPATYPHAANAACDGHHVWIPPTNANMIVKVDKTTGAMAGFNSWPTGFSGTSFLTTIYDGKYVWFTPADATHMIRIEASTGILTGFLKPATWATTNFKACTIDFSTGSLWMPFHSLATDMVRVSFKTSTTTKTITIEATTTKEDGIVLQNGNSFAGIIPHSSVKPLSGDTMTLVKDHNGPFPAGWTCTSSCYYGSVATQDYIWMMPMSSHHQLLRLHKHTGSMTAFTGWPGAVTMPSSPFGGASWDREADQIWLNPRAASHVISVDVTTGAMSYCPTWPSGYVMGVLLAHISSTIQGNFLWLSPCYANQLVRYNLRDCSVTGHDNWAGVTFTGSKFGGIIFDGFHTAWLPAHGASHVVKVDLWSVSMTISNAFPAGLTATNNQFFLGGCFDGTYAWMGPFLGNKLIKMHSQTDTIVDVSNWPTGYSLGSVSSHSTLFDGKYVWVAPRDASHLLRVNTIDDTMTAFALPVAFPKTLTLAIDLSTGSMWLPFWGTGANIYQVSFSTPSIELTASQEVGLIMQDGASYSGVVPYSNVVPLAGPTMTTRSYSTGFPGGFSCGGSCFSRGSIIGSYLWLPPGSHNMLIKMHIHSGVMTGYTGWPGGVSLSATDNFAVSAYDKKRALLWLIPMKASHVVSVDVATGSMNSCAWSAGLSIVGWTFLGGFIQGTTDYLWSSPHSLSLIGRVNMADCSMSSYNGWPPGVTDLHMSSAIYDGDHHGFFLPAQMEKLLKVNLWTGAMTGHGSWPSGFSATAHKFSGGAFNGQTLWMSPWTANMIVAVDKDTMVMTKVDSWPLGFTLGANGLRGATTDGTYVWFPPLTASHLLRLEISTGLIVGFNNFPAGWTGSVTGIVDFETATLWMPTSLAIVGVSFKTPSATITQPPTPTPELGIYLQDGLASSGSFSAGLMSPLEGTSMSSKTFNTYPGSMTCTANCHGGILSIGDYIWMITRSAGTAPIIRMHKATGLMTGYNSWPAGLTYSSIADFSGGAYDRTRDLIWMIPEIASHVVTVDVSLSGSAGTMTRCTTSWPGSYSVGSGNQFLGGFTDGDSLWMAPAHANMVVAVSFFDCSMTGHNTWPGSFVPGSLIFRGAVFDGQFGWFIPRTANMVVKMTLSTGFMTGYGGWPGTFTFATNRMAGGTFDGQNVWMTPYHANMLVSVDTASGTMTEQSSFPPGYSLGGPKGAHHAALWDGRYVWCPPWSASHLLRIEASTGAMLGFNNMPSGFVYSLSATIDFDTSSLWVGPFGATTTVSQLWFHSATPSDTVTQSSTASAEPTRSQDQGLLLQDGGGTSGVVPWAQVKPLEGTITSDVSYPVPAGFSTGQILLVGDYVWAIPQSSLSVLRFHKHQLGAYTSYSSWPAGVTLDSTPSHNFIGGSYDPLRARIWMAPCFASHVVSIDTNTGAMSYCPTWPSGISIGTWSFMGSFIAHDDFWLVPTHAFKIVRYGMQDCASSHDYYDNWPGTVNGRFDHGAIFDGDHHAWFAPQSGGILKMNLWTKAMTDYDPTGLTGWAVTGTPWMGGVAFDGQCAWVVHHEANMIVQVDQTTGAMTGHTSWPTGYVLVPSASGGANYDGKYVWCIPVNAVMLLRIETGSGAMTGFAWTYSDPRTSIIDFETQSIYFAAGYLIRLSFRTPTIEKTASQPLGLLLQDGSGSSEVVPWSQVKPLEGTVMTDLQFTIPSSLVTTGVVLVGDYLWTIPKNSIEVTRFHKHQVGTYTIYNTWPAGVTLDLTPSNNFAGGSYDKERGRIWMSPCWASHVVYVDTTTGAMGYCPTWPASISMGSWSFTGSMVAGHHVWFSPTHADMIVRYDMRDCAPVGYNSWPGAVTGRFDGGVVFDGDHHGWFLPGTGSILRMNLWTGAMTGHDQTAVSGWAATGLFFAGGTFDGQSIWMPPWETNMIIKIDKDTDAMTGYNSWPTGYGSVVQYAHRVALYDGKYLWCVPYSAPMFLRVEAHSGTISGISHTTTKNWRSGVMDFESQSFFVASNSLVRISFHTPTSTSTDTATISTLPTTTRTETVTPAPTSTATEVAPATPSRVLTKTLPLLPSTPVPTTPALAAPTALPMSITVSSVPKPQLSATLQLPSPLPSSPPLSTTGVWLQVSAVLASPSTTSCGAVSEILTNGTRVGDNFTVQVFLDSSIALVPGGTVSVLLPLWMLRNASVSLAVVAGGGSASSSVTSALSLSPLAALSTAPTITSFSPSLPRLRSSGATHLTITGTLLNLLPPAFTVGPFVLNVSVNLATNTSAILGPVPNRAYTVSEIQAAFPLPVTIDREVVVPGALRLLAPTSSGSCPLAILQDQLAGLPAATFVDVSDFYFFSNGSVTLMPRIVPTVRYDPTGPAFLLARSYPTVEAGGASLDMNLVGVIFEDLAGASVVPLNGLTTTTTVTSGALLTGWSRSNATHHSFSLSQDAGAVAPWINLTISHKWGIWREATQFLSFQVIRPSFTVVASVVPYTPAAATTVRRQGNSAKRSNSGHTTVYYGVHVELSSADGSPRNVSTKLLLQSALGAVSLYPDPQDTGGALAVCTNQFPNQLCLIPRLVIGQTQALKLVVAAPSYFKADLRMSYEVSAASALSTVSGEIALTTSGSAASSGSNAAAVTQSPPSNAAAGANSPIFGFADGAPCYDALLMSWVLFVVVIGVLFAMSLYMARSMKGAGHEKPEMEIEGEDAIVLSFEQIKLEALRAEWRKPRPIQSLLIQHKWFGLLCPCHDQCAVAHGLTSFAHLLTLMWLSAVFLLAVSGDSSQPVPTTSLVAAAVLAVIVAQPFGPLLSFYYSQVLETSAGGDQVPQLTTTSAGRSGERGTQKLSEEEEQREKFKAAVSVKRVAPNVNVTGLDDVELEDDKMCAAGEEEEEEEEELDADRGSNLEDDIILEKQEEGVNEREIEEGGEEGGTSKPHALGTIHALHSQENELEATAGPAKGDPEGFSNQGEEEAAETRKQEIAVPAGSSLVPTSGTVFQATPWRKKGHFVNGVYIALATLLILILGPQFQSPNGAVSGLCPAYLSRMLPMVLVIDILVAQSLVVILTFGYRWMVSDPEAGQAMEAALHPRDCFIRDEYQD